MLKRFTHPVLIVLFLSLLSGCVQTVYQCRSDDGEIVEQSNPCP